MANAQSAHLHHFSHSRLARYVVPQVVDGAGVTGAPTVTQRREGLPFVRLAMVVSSLAPLFVLWAVRGINPIPDKWLITACAFLIAIPNAILLARLWTARRRSDKKSISVVMADDHRDHLIVYLFAMLIPLFESNVGNPRDSAATAVALLLVIFLFWHLNLHYMNIVFALFGYRVFTVRDDEDTHLLVLLSQRSSLPRGTKLHAYRLSNTVFIEVRQA